MIEEELIPRRIRKIRKRCKMTQQELADAAGVTKGYISKIENGVSSPPVGTLIAFATALHVELNAFFETEHSDTYATVTKNNQRHAVALEHGAQYEHLALNFPRRAFESYVIKTPGHGKTSEPNKHKGQELIYVLKGMIEFFINGDSFVLEAGDSIHFNASYTHYGICLSEDGAEILGVIYSDPATETETKSSGATQQPQ